MRTRLFLLLILLLPPISYANADTKKQADISSPIIVAVYGDSLAAGFGLPPEDAMPAQLQAKLRMDGIAAEVLNDGVSGDTTAGGLSRLDTVLAQKPSIVVIVLGGNDLLRALPVATIRDNLDTIMARFHKAGVKMLLMGQRAPASLGMTYAASFNAMYAELASKYNASLYPVYLAGAYGNAALMQQDGIHPNRDGVAFIVSRFEPQIKQLIR
jgi:acyl-CoA thioesterase-1